MEEQKKMQKTKVIALIGKAGSGKDYLAKQIYSYYPHLHRKVSYTTRPPREGEKEGQDYFYITDEEFFNTLMFEKACFNGWWYGTGHKGLKEDKINIGIFNPAGVRQMLQHPEIEARVFEIVCDDKIRLIRQLERENQPNVKEIVRRFGTDEKDFSSLDFPHIKIDNSKEAYFALSQLYGQLKDWFSEGQK